MKARHSFALMLSGDGVTQDNYNTIETGPETAHGVVLAPHSNLGDPMGRGSR